MTSTLYFRIYASSSASEEALKSQDKDFALLIHTSESHSTQTACELYSNSDVLPRRFSTSRHLVELYSSSGGASRLFFFQDVVMRKCKSSQGICLQFLRALLLHDGTVWC